MSLMDTTDLYLASFLHAQGHELVDVKLAPAGDKAAFCFRDRDACWTDVLAFYNKLAMCQPQALFTSFRDLKQLAFQVVDGRKPGRAITAA